MSNDIEKISFIPYLILDGVRKEERKQERNKGFIHSICVYANKIIINM